VSTEVKVITIKRISMVWKYQNFKFDHQHTSLRQIHQVAKNCEHHKSHQFSYTKCANSRSED